jgi:hypothetical protein
MQENKLKHREKQHINLIIDIKNQYGMFTHVMKFAEQI